MFAAHLPLSSYKQREQGQEKVGSVGISASVQLSREAVTTQKGPAFSHSRHLAWPSWGEDSPTFQTYGCLFLPGVSRFAYLTTLPLSTCLGTTLWFLFHCLLSVFTASLFSLAASNSALCFIYLDELLYLIQLWHGLKIIKFNKSQQARTSISEYWKKIKYQLLMSIFVKDPRVKTESFCIFQSQIRVTGILWRSSRAQL